MKCIVTLICCASLIFSLADGAAAAPTQYLCKARDPIPPPIKLTLDPETLRVFLYQEGDATSLEAYAAKINKPTEGWVDYRINRVNIRVQKVANETGELVESIILNLAAGAKDFHCTPHAW